MAYKILRHSPYSFYIYVPLCNVPCMVSLPSSGHLVTMRSWWNIQGLASRPRWSGTSWSPMLWKGNIPPVPTRRTFSSHCHKDRASRYLYKTIPLDVNIVQMSSVIFSVRFLFTDILFLSPCPTVTVNALKFWTFYSILFGLKVCFFCSCFL